MNGPNGQGLLSVCLTQPMQVPNVLSPSMINTELGECTLYAAVDSGGTQACIMVARDIAIAAGGVATSGTLPLVLLATQNLYINGPIDLSAQNNRSLGAGSN